MLIRADSESEKDMWMRSLDMQIDLAKGGSGDGIVTSGKTASIKKKIVDHSIESEIDRTLVLIQQVENASGNSKSESINLKAESEISAASQPKHIEQRSEDKSSKHDNHAKNSKESTVNDVFTVEEHEISRDY